MFTIGDIVKPKFGANGVEYYIVTDVADFSRKNDGSDMSYEVMKIFPVTKISSVENIDEKRLALVGKNDTKDSKMILDYVMRHREKKGWNEVPSYMAHIQHNKKVIRYKQKSTGEIILLDGNDTDAIRYDLLETIDDCLDRMNDLQDLYNVFGDEAYLVLRQVVQDRLKKIDLGER